LDSGRSAVYHSERYASSRGSDVLKTFNFTELKISIRMENGSIILSNNPCGIIL
jgi:hypothetical protein